MRRHAPLPIPGLRRSGARAVTRSFADLRTATAELFTRRRRLQPGSAEPESRQSGESLATALRHELRICSLALRRIGQSQTRQARSDAMANRRDWRKARRDRTHLLIEYGGLVVKAALPERVEDDRATVLGGLLWLCDQLDGLGDDSPADLKARWRRRGLRVFEADAATKEVGNRRKDEAQPMKPG